MSNLQEYTDKIIDWAEERGLTTASPVKQMLKLAEETGELGEGMAKDKPIDIKDAIGDIYVVLTILEEQSKNVNSNEEKAKEYDNIDDQTYYFLHLLKELGTLSANIMYGYYDIAIFNTDRVLEGLERLTKSLNLDLTDCVEQAYNEIKDRRGKMINGVFVKESDLNGETNNVIMPYDVKLKPIRNIVELHGEDGNWNNNIGNMGMYNGVELILAALKGREPKYRTLKDEQADLEVQE